MIWNFKEGDMLMTISEGPVTLENVGTERMIGNDKNNQVRIYIVETGELMKKTAMSLKESRGWKIKYHMTPLNHPEYFV